MTIELTGVTVTADKICEVRLQAEDRGYVLCFEAKSKTVGRSEFDSMAYDYKRLVYGENERESLMRDFDKLVALQRESDGNNELSGMVSESKRSY